MFIKIILVNILNLVACSELVCQNIGAKPFDVVINELMVRPSPPVGLPEAEYIELFNRSVTPVNIEDWTITVGSRSRILPPHIIEPGEHLLIAHEKHATELAEFGNVIGLPAFPVLAMGGQTIVLRCNRKNVISAIRYSDKWYGSNLKESGGWSLEQIDPFNPCGGAANWTASADSRGGTPGRSNSVKNTNPDLNEPRLIRSGLMSNGGIRLHFNKQMHPLSGWSPSGYYAEAAGHPLWVLPTEPLFETVDIFFGYGFEPGKEYIISITDELYDCSFNYTGPDNEGIRFTLPSVPEPGDIIINEILFNPLPGGANFLELLNISGNTFDLRSLLIAGMKDDAPDPAFKVTGESYLLFPGEYVVLSTNSDAVISHYYTPRPESLISVDRLPPLYNESGRVVLTCTGMKILDDLKYNSDMHHPLLTNRKGVSLERISHLRPSSDPSNWTSASETSGYATPGYRNSQFSPPPSATDNVLSVEPGIFSPDNSGYHDMANISYKLEKPGFTGNITIFDSRGKPVKRLVRNELLGTSGTYSWDGRNEYDRMSRLGIYLILLELMHPEGEVLVYREIVVLGGRFRK